MQCARLTILFVLRQVRCACAADVGRKTWWATEVACMFQLVWPFITTCVLLLLLHRSKVGKTLFVNSMCGDC